MICKIKLVVLKKEKLFSTQTDWSDKCSSFALSMCRYSPIYTMDLSQVIIKELKLSEIQFVFSSIKSVLVYDHLKIRILQIKEGLLLSLRQMCENQDLISSKQSNGEVGGVVEVGLVKR